MTAQSVTCPPDAVLNDFGLGKLDAARVETISRHLETCADCQQRVASLPGDSFVGRLRQADGAAPPKKREGTYVPGESLANAASSTDGSSASNVGQPPSVVGREDGLPVASHPQAGTRREPPGRSGPSPSSPVSAPPELADHPDYELIKELGQGGMGTVYLAKNRMMGRQEVLKVISQAVLNKQGARERFLREIQSAANLSHPNIVTAYSVLRPGDSLVFAMEYVRGQDLAAVVKQRGPLPVANAAFYIHQVANGLQHAFEKGMVHRDVKPNNLMLAIEGKKHVVKILDFGLAKATSEKGAEAGLTKSGQMLGTPDYVAPEQSLDAHKADIRADIYSLGCTLYFLLSGGPPFQETSLYGILEAHHKRDPKPLNLVRPDVPLELAAIVSKMMAKDPTKRYQTPIEVARALVPFFKAGQSPSTTPISAAQSQTATSTVTPAESIEPPPLVLPIPVARPVPMAAAATPTMDLVDELSLSIDAHRPSVRRYGGWTPWPPRRKTAAIVAAGAAALLLLGIVLLVRTANGTIQIALSDPKASVTVTVDGKHIDVAGLAEPLSLEVGEHNFKVTGKGYETITDRFTVNKRANAPLTITLTPEKSSISPPPAPPMVIGGTIDLLKLIDPSRDAIRGKWQLRDGQLITPAKEWYTQIEVPYDLPTEYRLTAIAKCATHDADLYFGLTMAGSQTLLVLDGFIAAISGLEMIDDGQTIVNHTGKRGRLLKDGEPNTIVCTVRKRRIHVTCNGAVLVDWAGDPKRLSLPTGFTPLPRRLFIGSVATFHITRLEITPFPEFEDEPKPPLDAVVNESKRIANQYRATAASTALSKKMRSEGLVNDSLNEADPAARYAMLDLARTLATSAGMADAALKVVDEMADRFDVDALRLKLDSLAETRKGGADEAAIVSRGDCALQLIAAASAAERFAEAKEAVNFATEAAEQLKNAALRNVQLQEGSRRGRLLRIQQQAHDAVKAELNRLAVDPNDPDANLAVGRYQCFFKGDWESGLEQLARGSDPALRILAAHDLAQPTAKDEQRAIADGYWDLSRAEKAPAKNALAARARRWYRRALPVGRGDQAIEQRLREIDSEGLVGNVQFLSELQEKDLVVANNGFGKGRNPVEGHALTAGGKLAVHSLFTDGAGAFASVKYDLGRRASVLHAHVGIDEACACEQPPSSRLVFHVFGEGELLWKSPELFGKGNFAVCEVPLDNVRSIELRVACHNNSNCAHAVWVEPEITWAADFAADEAAVSRLPANDSPVADTRETGTVSGAPVDLLKLIDRKQNLVVGEWRHEFGQSISPWGAPP
ncbi:MAG TPA: protein kinase [Pirellulales bacterium]|nr:protein kinase [Pirellulales bacterium]